MKYDVKMQQDNDIKRAKFNKILGQVIKNIRIKDDYISISKLAREYDLDRGNLSKLERGINGCNIVTAWKICEAANIKFSEFAKLLEKELGKDFKFTDE